MQLRRAPDAEKAKLELQLEELDDKMPAPLASIYSVNDEPKKASPIQDEWGFFDPERCGFAALLTKLDSINNPEDAPAKKPARSRH